MDDRFELMLSALRSHVSLDSDVSDALTALHAREGARLAVVLKEAREFAGELDSSQERPGSKLDLDAWLGRVLRGPHDGTWFSVRLRSGRDTWGDVPPLASAVLISRVRQQLTEIAATCDDVGTTAPRIMSALGRLFDLEMAIIILDLGAGGADDVGPTYAPSVPQEATLAIGNALAVIETSAYLIGRYCAQGSPPTADVERHVERILRQVERTKIALGQLAKAIARLSPFVH